ESLPVEKGARPVAADVGIGDRSSLAFSGTTIASGSGSGVVVGTGRATEIGHITTMLDEVESIETPLTRQMTSFSTKLSIVVVIAAVVMFAVGWILYDYTLADLTLAAIGFAVAAIPEGLPAVLTITLALEIGRASCRERVEGTDGSVRLNRKE